MGASKFLLEFYFKSGSILILVKEGWLAEHAVSEDDKLATERIRSGPEDKPDDLMQGLEGLDVAGPKID